MPGETIGVEIKVRDEKTEYFSVDSSLIKTVQLVENALKSLPGTKADTLVEDARNALIINGARKVPTRLATLIRVIYEENV